MSRNFAALLLAMSLCAASQAQSIPRPTVTKAQDLLLSVPDQVAVGTDLVFRRKPSAAARGLVRSGLQVRVFSLHTGASRPTAIGTDSDNCDVYLSVVHPLDATNDTDIPFRRLDHTWLVVTSGGEQVKEGRYYIVFEQAGPKNEHFRIKHGDDANSYFDTGFVMEVHNNNGSANLQQVRQEYRKREGRLGRLYEELDRNPRAFPCYSYKAVTVKAPDGAPMAQGELQPCSTG